MMYDISIDFMFLVIYFANLFPFPMTDGHSLYKKRGFSLRTRHLKSPIPQNHNHQHHDRGTLSQKDRNITSGIREFESLI